MNDRLFPQQQTAIAPQYPQNLIAYFLITKTAIAPHHPQNPIAYSPPNSDRTLNTHKTRSPISHIKQQLPITPHKPDRLFPSSNSDYPHLTL
jgi:hypothetical protein